MQWLVKTIEAEIIPRLMAAHQDDPKRNPDSGASAITAQDVLEFSDIALKQEAAYCANYIDSIVNRGVPLDRIYLELLAPAARRLGEMWTADLCTFTDVTIGLWRMQQVMYDLSPVFQSTAQEPDGLHKRHVMLMTVPGSQHTMGLLMVGEFFRRAGWSVWGEPAADRDRLLEAIEEEWFDVAGISVSSEPQLEHLAEFITELRRASQNSSICIMLGGPIFSENPQKAFEYGADVTAADAAEAIQAAEKEVATRQQKSAMKRGDRRAI